MRIRIWIAAVLAILGMVNTASASISYSISDTVTSGSLTGSAGSSVTVNLFLNETLTGSTSLINTQGIYAAALGINSSNSLATITAATNAFPTTPAPVTGPLAQINAAGTQAALDWTASNNATTPGTTAQGGTGLVTTSSFPSTAASGNVLLGSLTITIGSAATTYTVGTGYSGSSAASDGAPTILLYANGSNIAFAGQNGGDPSYTGFMDGGAFSFTVTPTASVPEPSSLLLCGFALSGMGYGAWRRRKSQKTETETAVEPAV